MTNVLNNTPDADYLSRLAQVVDIDNWLGYFAINAILGNQETSLSTGVGDDYSLYRGTNDPRFVLIPHDMDSVFGQGDSIGTPTSGIYRATGSPALQRFLTHDAIAPLYHDKLQSLLEGVFAKKNLDPMLDDLLADFMPANLIADMKSFMDTRRQFILDEITMPLTATSGLPLSGGFHRTTQDIAAISGTAPKAETKSILVNGQEAAWNPFDGTWSLGEGFGGGLSTLVSSGAVWSYLDAGQVPTTTPGADWRVDDPGWTDSGPAQLGYGNNGETTTVDFVDTDPVQSGTQKNITTHFRRTFNVTDAATFTSLTMRLVRDDGAVVYLNGTEVERSNMPTGTIDDTTRALSAVGGSSESSFFDFALDPADLVEGENVIAVEIHQVSSGSSDLSFDLELLGTAGDPTATSGIALRPGVNRLWVEAFDGPNGTGARVDATPVDVWYDDGDTQTVGGAITTDTTWTAAAGPYVVTSNLTISDGTLTIEPGTTVFFNPGTGLTVTGNGRLLAEGTEHERIRLTHNPLLGNGNWEGLSILDTSTDNRLTYIDMESGDASGQAVLIDNATAIFDHAAWFGINNQVLDLRHPTLQVLNSDIPGISGDETIHLVGLDADLDEELIFEGDIIRKNTSGGDVVDISHNETNPATVIFRNNIFLGGLDDGIDTDGFQVLIEDNYFTDFHLGTSRPTTSNAVSTGRVSVNGQVVSSNLTLRGNLFFDNDHDILLKDFSFVTATNNTFVGATIGTIQFTEIGGSNVLGPGLGIDLDGNIFWDSVLVFQDLQPESQVTLNRSIVPAALVGLGVGNLSGDPLLADPARGDFSLLNGSPAIGTGPNGTDIGAIQRPTPADATNLRITELHYHPVAGKAATGEVPADADWFEFVELQNTSGETIDLSGVSLATGVHFAFPWGTSLEAGKRILVVKDQGIFESRYGAGLPVAGEYANFTSLSNTGEQVTLLAADASIIQQFNFNDKTPWPTAADGNGPSLVVIDTNGDYNDPTNWKDSNTTGGTPGTAEAATIPGDYNADGMVNAADYTVW